MTAQEKQNILKENLTEFQKRLDISKNQKILTSIELADELSDSENVFDALKDLESLLSADEEALLISALCKTKLRPKIKDMLFIGSTEPTRAGAHSKISFVRNKYNDIAFEKFSKSVTNAKPDYASSFKEACENVYKKILMSKENIVLCGMPSSGKSTVGKILAEKLSMGFVDTDDVIVDTVKCPITEIFRESGEKVFRDIESEAVCDVSALSGHVIATGGGAILRDENVRRLRRNGRLFFLDRPLNDLIPTSDRPLASDREAIEKRYKERYPRYNAVADIVVAVDTDADGVADKIIKESDVK